MPFTFSHPAIVLPLKKVSGKAFSLTGLITGSIAPDFEYFIRMRVKSIYSHSIPGLFWFDLPLGLLLAFVYHGIVRHQLISNLPSKLNKKLSAYKQFDWTAYFKKNWLIAIISVIIGAASHIFWDDFTHPSGYFVKHIGVLKFHVTVFKFHTRLFNVAQQLSTLFGGLVVLLT